MPVSSLACKFWLLFAVMTLTLDFEFCFILQASTSDQVQIQQQRFHASVWFSMQVLVVICSDYADVGISNLFYAPSFKIRASPDPTALIVCECLV